MTKAFIRAIVLLVLTVIALIAILSVYDYAFADTFYVLCRPGAEVNVREKEANGFVHVVNLNAETNSGWIYKGLLSEDEPIPSTGKAQVFGATRVACRKYADGKLKRWAYEGENVEIYAISERWCVTEYGYIMTDFLTVNAPVRGKQP